MFYPFYVKSKKLMSVCQAKTSKEKHSQEKSCNIMQSKYLVLDISNVQTYKISVFSLLRLYGTLCVLVITQSLITFIFLLGVHA